ncbi:MAG TPA: NAD(P)H-dependent oxidoreductase subunit E [Solirubrobacteraceae bacterium]|nr:NAD(P)H-dependent oxidoreductase subunit E [Solirubrobacteraceae bacterium]
MSFGHRRAPDLNDELAQRHGEHREPIGSLSRRVPRFGHGSRVPGWDDAVDLTKDPAVIPDPATTEVPEELRREIEAAMAKYPDRRSAAIPSLHAAQAVHGWCSPEAITQVAAVMRLTPAYLTSVASFYDMFELHPKHANDVFVCTNISCSILGADEFYEAMARAAEGEDIDVRSFECLGACDIAPMASVNGEYVGPLELADADRIVEDLNARRPVLSEKQLRYRRSVDPNVQPDRTGAPDSAAEFSEPDQIPRADTAGLTDADHATDRPGPSAPLEVPPHDQSET